MPLIITVTVVLSSPKKSAPFLTVWQWLCRIGALNQGVRLPPSQSGKPVNSDVRSTKTKGCTVSRKTNDGKTLNKEWGVNAEHALYREDGIWYHHLRYFPGALFDKNGYILFETENDYLNCSYINFGQDINILQGISKIPGYIRVK